MGILQGWLSELNRYGGLSTIKNGLLKYTIFPLFNKIVLMFLESFAT